MARPLSLSFSLAALLSLAATAQAQDPKQARNPKQTEKPKPGKDLTFADGKPATEFIHKQHDPKHHHDTCKVFHHVRALDGTLLTKGNGGKFQHHKGLFIGWNQTRWNGRKFDFWHMPKKELQVFQGYVDPDRLSMPPQAQVAEVHWVTPEGEPVVVERRGLQIVKQDKNSYTLHLRNELRAPNHDVKLGGDPQHAGQQFRSPQKFAPDGATKVTYLRPKSAEDHGNDVWTGCSWIAAIQTHGDKKYTILRVEGLANPGKTTWSTRDYGRFGATRTVKVTKGKPLVLDQYYVIANGERDTTWCQAQATMLRTRR